LQETHGFFNIDGRNLEYQLLIPPHGYDTTLIFLHEGLGCLAMWRDFPLQVAQLTGCRVLTYSRAGYGDSDPCTLPRPLTFMHDEGLKVLPQVLDINNIQKAILVGHSDGASIALINAGGIDDQRIQGLILMAPHVFVEEVTLNSIREAKNAYQESDLRSRLARYHGDRVDNTFLGWVQVWLDENFKSWNLEGFLPKVKMPVLLIQGDQDQYGTLKQLRTINKQLPDEADMVILPGCEHSPFRECPQETLQAITAFLEERFSFQ
jgi:pimeloyl-ACP methyl ester carboxylesterase